ncbi:dnaJ homolog subfamily C member 15-like [Heterodontus francisci]|uniref:dnaJ homolog subfamily C member 15-like n=1 Tax=Heterodontus francisci TaxID=7792 RepID=UPI00355B2DFB
MRTEFSARSFDHIFQYMGHTVGSSFEFRPRYIRPRADTVEWWTEPEAVRKRSTSCGTVMGSEQRVDNGGGRTLIAVGLGVAAAAFAGRHAFRLWKPLQQMIVETARIIPGPSFSTYYKGGFEAKMNKREASLVLGVSPSASRTKIGEAHKRIMLLNHPDKGGSPFLAAKINEAKEIMDSSSKK